MRRAAPFLLGLVLLPTPLALTSLGCWWLLVASASAGRTWVARAVLALFTCFAVVAGTLTTLAVLHVRCDPRLLLATLLVTTYLLVRRAADRPVPRLSQADAWSACFGLLTFAVLYVPFIGASTGRTMALMSQTTDGATHVELVAAVMRQRGYIHLVHPSGLSPDVEQYPTGWHGNVWVVVELLLGHHPSTGALVRVVAFLAIDGYALLCALAARVALGLAGCDEQRIGRARAALVLASLGLGTLVGFGLYFVQLDSYTQIVALAALLALAVLAEDSGRSGDLRTLVALAALSVVVCQSWYLLAPVAGVMVLVVLTDGHRPKRVLVPLALATAPICLYPLLTGPSRLHVDESGPMLLPTIGGVIGLLVVTAIGVVRATGARSHVARVLVAGTVSSLLMMVALVARQGFVAGSGVSYYGAKLLLTTFLFGSVLGAATATLAHGRQRLLALVVVCGLAAGAKATAWASFPPRASDHAGRLEAAVLTAQAERYPHGPPEGTDVVVADGCDRVDDMVASKWVYDTSLTWPDGLRATLDQYADERAGSTAALGSLVARTGVQHLELWVTHPCDTTSIDRLVREPSVRVIHVS